MPVVVAYIEVAGQGRIARSSDQGQGQSHCSKKIKNAGCPFLIRKQYCLLKTNQFAESSFLQTYI